MALTAARDTKERAGDVVQYPLAAATTIYLGGLVALNSSGNAVPAADTAGLRVRGRAEGTVDNSGGSAGDETVDVKRGVFLFANSATNAVDADDKGKLCFVEDDETVAETSTNKIVAGRVVDITTEGVWVDTRDLAIAAAVATTVGAALSAITGGESPTEAEHNTVITQVNALRVDVLALAAALNT